MIHHKDYLRLKFETADFCFRVTEIKDNEIAAILIEGMIDQLTPSCQLYGNVDGQSNEIIEVTFIDKTPFLRTYMCRLQILQLLPQFNPFSKVPAVLPVTLNVPGYDAAIKTESNYLGCQNIVAAIAQIDFEYLWYKNVQAVEVNLFLPNYTILANARISHFVPGTGHCLVNLNIALPTGKAKKELYYYIMFKRLELNRTEQRIFS